MPKIKEVTKIKVKPKKSMRQIAKDVMNRNMEQKWAVATLAAQTYSATWTITHLTNIAQGDAYNMRDGDAIKVNALRYDFHCKPAALDGNNNMRVVFVQSYDGGTPAASTFLPSNANGWYGTFNQKDTMKCIKDIHVNGLTVYNDQAAGATSGPGLNCIRKKGFIRFKKPIYVKYTAGTCTRNGIYMCIISDSGAVTHPTISGYYTLYWKDI